MQRRAWPALTLLWVMVVLALFVVIAPTAGTQPFRFHTPAFIERLYLIRSWATPVTVTLTVVGALIAAGLWRRDGRRAVRAATVVAVAALTTAAFFSRQHLVEWLMFEPAPELAFVAASTATHVDADDLVLGVVSAAGARAYPVRMAAYHHIFNDRLGDEPFVVTY